MGGPQAVQRQDGSLASSPGLPADTERSYRDIGQRESAIRGALEQYRTAYESRNPAAIASTYSAATASPEKVAAQSEFLGSISELRVGLSDIHVKDTGGPTANVQYVQSLSFLDAAGHSTTSNTRVTRAVELEGNQWKLGKVTASEKL